MDNIFNTLDKGYIIYENMTIAVIIDKNEEPWFHAKNTAFALGYKNLKNTVQKHVDKNDKKQLKNIKCDFKTGQLQTIYLNEAGHYFDS
jgi:prophage antirepressor-like protein